VGYAGGSTANPDYGSIGDHSETIRVDFDPAVVSYQQLLATFWDGHYPTGPAYSNQYRSAIFCTTDLQRKLAAESMQAEQARLGKPLFTSIESYTGFYAAEDYHQKYYLRMEKVIVDPLYVIYPDPADFRDSTAAARLNGYAMGYGDPDTLKKDLDALGLSEAGKKALLRKAESGLSPACAQK
jgi:peptide-methionine (S)-S-oxide reductase